MYIREDLYNNSQKTFKEVNNIVFNDQGTAGILKGDSTLIWLDLGTSQVFEICLGQKVANSIRFSSTGTRMIYGLKEGNGISIYQYNPSLNHSEKLLDNYTKDIDKKVSISENDFNYSSDGKFVLFKMTRRPDSLIADTMVITGDVNIWNFKDKDLQSHQLNFGENNKQYLACFSLGTRKVIQLETDEQTPVGATKNGFAIVKNRTSEFETYWNGENPQYRLLSLLTGKQVAFIPSSTKNPESVCFSESGMYITWSANDAKETFCYSIKTGAITKLVLQNNMFDRSDTVNNSNTFKLLGWLKDDVAVIGHDNFDVWQVDPANQKRPIPITGDYGKKNGIQFRPIELDKKYSLTTPNDSMILTAMEVSTKFNGYKKVRLSKINNPGKDFMGPYLYYFPEYVYEIFVPHPIKSNASPGFLLPRQSDTSPVNLFFTRDFVNYKQVSDIKPLGNYRSYKAELIKWADRLGEDCFGVLYKPQDLDTSRKYPVIFNYYEKRSFERYQYKFPALSTINVNVPWYTSRGYAVFIPDISPMRGKTGPIALETMERAADYLTNNYSWIDRNRMGAQGHSHGGYFTNYVVTHSRLFAAAQSSAGYSNFISAFGQLGFGHISLQFMQEVGQNNLGTTPSKGRDVYIENSCIFSVDKVATPLLMMHNRSDGAVPFAQAVELFTALRREKKRVWLLEYDNEDHGLSDRDHILDFCIRQQQFFDHYLKETRAPLWMVEGIPAKYKGTQSGLQLDSLNRRR
jgi:dienelactone hydrolase